MATFEAAAAVTVNCRCRNNAESTTSGCKGSSGGSMDEGGEVAFGNNSLLPLVSCCCAVFLLTECCLSNDGENCGMCGCATIILVAEDAGTFNIVVNVLVLAGVVEGTGRLGQAENDPPVHVPSALIIAVLHSLFLIEERKEALDPLFNDVWEFAM